jgi:predicted amidophosphoribosyltransferase
MVSMNWGQGFFSCLLELVFPEHCSRCEAAFGTVPWVEKGPALTGLRPWDGPHLCLGCLEHLEQEECATRDIVLEDGQLVPVLAARWTNPLLVDLIGSWKYKGVRGLVGPLGQLLVSALAQHDITIGGHTLWVPLPLHRRRQRERGFNQAEMLAAQLAFHSGGKMQNDLVVRCRSTRQQAKLVDKDDRLENMRGVFGPGKNSFHPDKGHPIQVILVDDLVTSGATAGTLIKFLQSMGLAVECVVCLGLAHED